LTDTVCRTNLLRKSPLSVNGVIPTIYSNNKWENQTLFSLFSLVAKIFCWKTSGDAVLYIMTYYLALARAVG